MTKHNEAVGEDTENDPQGGIVQQSHFIHEGRRRRGGYRFNHARYAHVRRWHGWLRSRH